jgi:hypothetical protein
MGNCIVLPQIFNAKKITNINSSKSEQNSKRISITQEARTLFNTALYMNHTTININREFHDEEISTYWLPKDEDEQQRLIGVGKSCYILSLITDLSFA